MANIIRKADQVVIQVSGAVRVSEDEHSPGTWPESMIGTVHLKALACLIQQNPDCLLREILEYAGCKESSNRGAAHAHIKATQPLWQKENLMKLFEDADMMSKCLASKMRLLMNGSPHGDADMGEGL
jgi:hypothetical protein